MPGSCLLPNPQKERGFTDSEMAIYSAAPFLIMSAIIVGSGLLSDLAGEAW